MPNDIKAEDFMAWEIAPSTRDSLHIHNKWVPVDVTLSAAGTAQNLFTVDTEQPTVNIVENPSFETADPPTGFTAVGSTLARVGSGTITPLSGSNSMEVNPDNSAAGEGFYWESPSFGSGRDNVGNPLYLVVSCFFARASGSGDDARIEIRDSAGTTTHATGNTVTLGTSFARSTAVFSLNSTAGVTYRIYGVTVTQHNTTYYAEHIQVELRRESNVTTYCDGRQGVNYEWDGTADASVSRRRIGLVTIRGYNLHVTRNCYLAFDHTASSTLGRPILAGTDFWTDFPIEANTISFINELSGETPRIFGEILGIHISGRTA